MNSKSISLSMLFVDYSVSINRYTQNLATPYVFVKCFPPGFIHPTFLSGCCKHLHHVFFSLLPILTSLDHPKWRESDIYLFLFECGRFFYLGELDLSLPLQQCFVQGLLFFGFEFLGIEPSPLVQSVPELFSIGEVQVTVKPEYLDSRNLNQLEYIGTHSQVQK